MAEAKETPPIFEDCIFAIVTSKEVTNNLAKELKTSLQDHGGEVVIVSNGTIDINEITHIISSTSDFPQYENARLQMIPVVTPSWVSSSLMRNKQSPIRPYTPDTRLFFSGVHLSCADIPTGDRDAITGAVLALGGMESSAVTRLTTHICALSLEHPKCQTALSKKLKCKIVLPHWFDDCLKLGKAIDSKPYEFPNPEIFEKKAHDNLPVPHSPSVEGATSPEPPGLLAPPALPSTRQLKVFEDRRVMLSNDLGLSPYLRQILESLVQSGKGSIVTSVHEADMYVCKYRDGRDYVFASRFGIDVGNLSWLYFLIANNEWTSPLKRLLHYPLPRDGIPGFKNFKITLSNYGGEARIYLENLVVAAGCEFTKSMKQDNTHLITARKNSEKCTAAEEWNINMVNHLWIEESYAKCQVQALTTSRYTHFPPRTNLGEVIGQTQFDLETLKTNYFPRDPTPRPEDPVVLRTLKNGQGSTEVGGNDDSDAMQVDKKPFAKPTPRRMPKTPAPTRTFAATTPSNRRSSTEKENDTPSSTNSRSAKDRAVSKLHDLAPDIALYEKEKKRAGKGVWGGKRAADQIDRERKSKEPSKTPSDDEEEAEDSSEDEVSGPATKKVKTNAPKARPPIDIRLIITGYKRWLGSPNKEDLEKKRLRDMGILVISDPLTCTHMAAPAAVRTQKFLCALAAGPTIVSAEFVDKCLDDKEVPDVKGFLLRDKAFEEKNGSSLTKVVQRARKNKRKLLHNVPVYCTAEIGKGLPETYESIVRANGGLFSLYRGRGGMAIKPTNPEDDIGGGEPVYLITGLKPEERKLWPKFEEMVRAGNMEPRIVMAEWLLDTAMSQVLSWSDDYLTNK
ncbi:hypothetical protein BP5796_08061 [Coleophoma crateriformis]|uniref:BRCT domain-containing protein n=1 Tax=Coleophoma crateriformis TaxID=565419 RepID=A0A3D8RD99_9HELO|nr:hypothetical protein BP5796_08061 [Coleophoma crateriformis]